MHILIVEDDGALRDVLVRALEEAGHVVDSAADGIAGESLAQAGSYDALVLDIMLPGLDGLEIVRLLRARSIATPVLLLTAKTTESDTIAGLDAGADDYLRKPFAVGELLARLRAISRRPTPNRPLTLTHGTIEFDPVSRRATRSGRELALTNRETIFLEYFLRNVGRVVSRDMIASAVWPLRSEIASNVIDVYVRRLRGKLEAPGEPVVLQTVRGFGYRLEQR